MLESNILVLVSNGVKMHKSFTGNNACMCKYQVMTKFSRSRGILKRKRICFGISTATVIYKEDIKFSVFIFVLVRHGGAVFRAVTSQRAGSGFKQGLSLWSLHVLPLFAWVPSGCSSFPPQSKDMQVWLIGSSKLPVGVSASGNGCLSLCVSPVMNWGPVHWSSYRWDQLQPSHDPAWDRQL